MCVIKLKDSLRKSIGIVLLLASIAGCSSEDDGGDLTGGISGTGKVLNGTVQNNRALASNSVQIKSAGNPVVTAPIDEQGVFSISELTGSAPYLLRVDFTSGDPFYALTYEQDGQQNIHAYSDLAIRNWYASQGIDVNDVFEGTISVIPTQEQILAQTNVISSLLETALAEYGLSGTNLFTDEYQADDQGVDSFLDNSPVIIINGNVNIIVTNPTTNQQSSLASNLSLETNLSLADADSPSQPSELRALSSENSEIVLTWDSSTDNIGVSRYDILRDGVVIATSTFPAYIDSAVEEGISYSYSVVAIDASGNPSVASDAVQAILSDDNTAPPTPENVSLVPTTDSVRISWEQQMISDVSTFEVILDSESLFKTTSTFAYHADLLSGEEYCYRIIAIDGSGNESLPTDITCTQTLVSGEEAPIVVPESEPVADDNLMTNDEPITTDEPIVGVPTEATIVGEWGGIMTIDSGEFPILIEIDADEDEGYVGEFSYPTRSSCRGDLVYVTNTDGVYVFAQDSVFTGGGCTSTLQVRISPQMFRSEAVLEYQVYDAITETLDYSGLLRSRSISTEDLFNDKWGGIIQGPNGDTPLVFNIEAGIGGTMSGDFFYPTRSSCRGSVTFVAKTEENYEFYFDSVFSSGSCDTNTRVTVSKSTVGSENTLLFKSFDPATHLSQYEGELQLQFVSPTDPIVGNWGGLVTDASLETPIRFNVEVDNSGTLSGNFDFTSQPLCRGSVNIVSKIGQAYEFYQDSVFTGGECSRNTRVRLSWQADAAGEALDYTLFDPETNLVRAEGSLRRR